MKDAIILFAHGSRDPQWAAPMRVIQNSVAQSRPQTHVELAFLELMQPDLSAAVAQAAAQGITSITVVPLFLASGGHLKKDLPELVEQAAKVHPQLSLRVLPPIGESETLLQSIADWVCAAAR